MKISLQYQDRKYFHPSPSAKMDKTIAAIMEKFGWSTEVPVSELTREEAKELIRKGISAAKRRKVRLFDTNEDEINKELALTSQ